MVVCLASCMLLIEWIDKKETDIKKKGIYSLAEIDKNMGLAKE